LSLGSWFLTFIDGAFTSLCGPGTDDSIPRASLNVNNVEGALSERRADDHQDPKPRSVVEVDSGWVSKHGRSLEE
jgi:hypothetical protein